jgi:hypothetical protein
VLGLIIMMLMDYPPTSTEVQGRVDLYLSPSVPLWHLYNNDLSPWPVTVLLIINPVLIFVGAL